MKSQSKIHPKTTIGHVHLKVSNIGKALKFYRDILGFEVMSRMGNSAVFLSAGGYHHHIGLNTWESAGGSPAPRGTTGLYHFAILVPTRKELAKVLKRLIENKYSIGGTADHGVSEAIYLNDPDGNGIEIYADKPKRLWPKDSSGKLIMYTKPLNIENLMKELGGK